MTILLTGGGGRTSNAIAQKLHEAKTSFLILSRTGSAASPFRACKFDWNDEATYALPFSRATDISAVYIVVPMTMTDEKAEPVIAFIQYAKTKGVKRFVALSASNAPPGQRVMGVVHDRLASLDVNYTVLRPTWYMETFSGNHASSIREEGKIYSATRDGKVSWVSTEDVGSVAHRALTNEPAENTANVLLGPELLSYDDIARILSDVLGKPVMHVRIPLESLKIGLETYGLAQIWTQILLEMETEFANNEEARVGNGEVLRLTGRPPTTFRAWAEKNKAVWIP